MSPCPEGTYDEVADLAGWPIEMCEVTKAGSMMDMILMAIRAEPYDAVGLQAFTHLRSRDSHPVSRHLRHPARGDKFVHYKNIAN